MLRAATRELVWGLRAASNELARWQSYARTIPDSTIREDAMQVFRHKRTHVHGAALFWTLPRERKPELLRLLVAYELIWDLLDNLSERATRHGQPDGYQLHLAIAEAIDPTTPISSYLDHHPWQDDAGYLQALVRACRECCAALPAYERVRSRAVRAAQRAQVLALNHYPDAATRDSELMSWVRRHYPEQQREAWWELSGAASAPLTIHALLAIAADDDCEEPYIANVDAAYLPVSAATTMLDSYVDQAEDAQAGNHSYVAHYPDADSMTCGLQDLITTALVQTRSLRNGETHTLIAAAMMAMYLSKTSARDPHMQATSRLLIQTGGSLTRLLHPILKAWRVVFKQRSA